MRSRSPLPFFPIVELAQATGAGSTINSYQWSNAAVTAWSTPLWQANFGPAATRRRAAAAEAGAADAEEEAPLPLERDMDSLARAAAAFPHPSDSDAASSAARSLQVRRRPQRPAPPIVNHKSSPPIVDLVSSPPIGGRERRGAVDGAGCQLLPQRPHPQRRDWAAELYGVCDGRRSAGALKGWGGARGLSRAWLRAWAGDARAAPPLLQLPQDTCPAPLLLYAPPLPANNLAATLPRAPVTHAFRVSMLGSAADAAAFTTFLTGGTGSPFAVAMAAGAWVGGWEGRWLRVP